MPCAVLQCVWSSPACHALCHSAHGVGVHALFFATVHMVWACMFLDLSLANSRHAVCCGTYSAYVVGISTWSAMCGGYTPAAWVLMPCVVVQTCGVGVHAIRGGTGMWYGCTTVHAMGGGSCV